MSVGNDAFKELFCKEDGTYSIANKHTFDLFYLWYDRELYKCSKPEKKQLMATDTFNRLHKLITYFKSFLPPNTLMNRMNRIGYKQ